MLLDRPRGVVRLVGGGELGSPELGPTEGLGAQVARDLDRRVDRGRQLVVARDFVELAAALQLDGVGRDDLHLAVVLGLQGAGALEERGVLAGRDLVLVGQGGGRGDLLVGGRGGGRRRGGSRGAGRRDRGGRSRRRGGLGLELRLEGVALGLQLRELVGLLLLLRQLLLGAVGLELLGLLADAVVHPAAGRDEGERGEDGADLEGAAGVQHASLLVGSVDLGCGGEGGGDVELGRGGAVGGAAGHHFVSSPFTMFLKGTSVWVSE